jgi:hypothetical protein
MASPMYGQNKADKKIDNSVYTLVGPIFSIAAADTTVSDRYGHVEIPAGSYVTKVALEVTTVASGGTPGTTQYDVGSEGDPDLFLDDVDGAAAATGMGTDNQFITAGGTAAVGAGGWYFASEDSISATCVAESSTAGAARIIVWLSQVD